jgi:hypothetical protein
MPVSFSIKRNHSHDTKDRLPHNIPNEKKLINRLFKGYNIKKSKQRKVYCGSRDIIYKRNDLQIMGSIKSNQFLFVGINSTQTY